MSAESPQDDRLNAAVYAKLRMRFLTGKIAPGNSLSTRSLAQELGVSQTPVRDALSRLAAEGAVEIRSKRRVLTPEMTQERFDDLYKCRLLLEPEAAAAAIPYLDAAMRNRLAQIDAKLDDAVARGDADAYMERNYEFHFTLYCAPGRRTLMQLIECLWLQFGPVMRLVYGRMGTGKLADRHGQALKAITAKDETALRAAIANDIRDGMNLIAECGLGNLHAEPAPSESEDED